MLLEQDAAALAKREQDASDLALMKGALSQPCQLTVAGTLVKAQPLPAAARKPSFQLDISKSFRKIATSPMQKNRSLLGNLLRSQVRRR